MFPNPFHNREEIKNEARRRWEAGKESRMQKDLEDILRRSEKTYQIMLDAVKRATKENNEIRAAVKLVLAQEELSRRIGEKGNSGEDAGIKATLHIDFDTAKKALELIKKMKK